MTTPAALHVVFGATGNVGQALVRELVARGKRVRAVSRRITASSEGVDGVEVTPADASDPAAARRAAEGASVIYNCVKLPYPRWARELPTLGASITDAAGQAGARLVVVEDLLMYGPPDGPLTEVSTYLATGKKGRTRIRMTEELRLAHEAGRVRVAVGRAAELYGAGVRLTLFGEQVFRAALAGKTIHGTGDLGAPHAQSYIDDVARGLATLGEHDEAFGEVWHLPVAPAISQREFMTLVYEEAGQDGWLGRLPGLSRRISALLNPMVRELMELDYQYEQAFEVDSGKFERAFGEVGTPYREGIRQTVARCRAAPDITAPA